MGSSATVRDPIDLALWGITAEVEFLPKLAEFWAQDPREADQSSFPYEWYDLMGQLETLDRAYRAGQMTPEQAERYRKLLRKLEEALPIIERLGLTRPPVSLTP